MLLFVGLGNPGKQYEMTRHNVGFQIIDTVARSFRFPEFSCKHDVAISIGNVGSHRVMLIKPLTYMNNSGEPVRRIVSMYKVPLDAVTVFHDDIDLRPGVVKVKRGGGSAGHNGIRSLDAAIGNNYWRVRFGVGRTGRDDVSSYVLAAFANLTEVQTAIDALAANISMLLDGNHKEFISKVSVPFKY